jgi:hypothetical protein
VKNNLTPVLDLSNEGLCEINLDPALSDRKAKTFIVLGAARGGTSMIAGIMHHLGISMGEKLLATYEDSRLSHLLLNGAFGELTSEIARRNDEHMVWGWKYPDLPMLAVLPKLLEVLRNPHVVAVFRDVLSIANRNRVSAGTDLFLNLKAAAGYYTDLIDYLAESSVPALLISYEKAVQNPALVVEKVGQFAGVAGKDVNRILTELALDKMKYLEATDNRCNGFVDRVTRSVISGWAYSRASDSPIDVEIEINGKMLGSTKASIYRADVKNVVNHPSGNVGYSFSLRPENSLVQGDVVRVFAATSTLRKELNRSPWVFDE